MNEEEKQAIKELKHFTNMTVFWKEKEYTSHEIDNCINIVLHLIDKQQKEIEKRLEEIDSLYKMMSAKDDEIEKLKEDYQILKDDIEEHNIVYVDTPEFEENYVSKDKIKEIFNTKICNCEYLSETDWTNELKVTDLRVANILKIILDELLGE